MYKSLGITFPLQDDVLNNRFLKTNATSREAYKSSLIFLLLTKKGERWYDPEFGTNLRKFLFEPNDSKTLFDITEELKITVSRYIPALNIINVDVDDTSTDTKVIINVKFSYNEVVATNSDSVQIIFTA